MSGAYRTSSVATERRITLLEPQFYVDPRDAYRWLRDEAPVYRDPIQQLRAISRYDDLRAGEVDARVLLRVASAPGSGPG